MGATRVLLVNPPSPERLGAPLLGLQYVAAALLRHGCEVRVIDAAARHFDGDPASILAEAEAFAPQVVGFGLFTRWVWHAYRLAEAFRGRFPLLVAGGAHTTVRPEETLAHGFDVAVVGEAEEAIVQLVERLERGEDVRGVVVTTPIADLDSVAPALDAQDLFDRRWYDPSGRDVVPGGILTSRGCPARCTFCANYVTGRLFRYRSAGPVVAELNAYYERTGASFYPCWDDALTANRPRLYELCETIEREIRFPLQWGAITRANMVNPELLAALRRAGLVHVNFGVESGDDDVLRAIKKGIKTDHVRRALVWAKEAGLTTACNFMLGFPQEDRPALERTLAFMEEIAPLVDTFSTLGVLVPFPGTPLYDDYHGQYGFTDWWLREDHARYSAPPAIEDVEAFRRWYVDDANLELDFFSYADELRESMREVMRFKAEHNLARMGLLDDPVFRPGPHRSVTAVGWDDPATARFYEQFDRRHDRYRRVNRALAREAGLAPGQRVLDVGGGLGGTTREALRWLGSRSGGVVCVEPAAVMRERGLRDPRVEWVAALPSGGTFDSVLCGASIWLLGPLRETVPRLAAFVAAGGALVFAIPALYLGEPDAPGGGRDPLLLELPAVLAAGRVPDAEAAELLPGPDEIDALLAAAGLAPRRWAVDVQLTQAALRDWLKIPPLTDALLPHLGPDERAAAVDAAYTQVDPASWRIERWLGWTASR